MPGIGVPPIMTEFSRIPPTTAPNKLIRSASAARPCLFRLLEKMMPEKKTGRNYAGPWDKISPAGWRTRKVRDDAR